MQTTMPPYQTERPQPAAKPAPPTRAMIEALRRGPPHVEFPALDREGVPFEPSAPPKKPVRIGPVSPAPLSAWPETGPCPGGDLHQHDANPSFRFKFLRRYGNVFTNKGCKFVMRTEHVLDLLRLQREFNATKPATSYPMTASNVLTAALDVVLDHQLCFTGLSDPIDARVAMARAVHRRAFVRFLPLYESL